jgi:hypothetical protein
MPASGSIARMLLLGIFGVMFLMLLSMPGSNASGISQSIEHLPGQLADSVWQRFRESDSLGALAMLHFSSYIEQPSDDCPSDLSQPDFAGDAALIADVRRIRQNEFERFESSHPENFDLWEKKLTPFAFGQKEEEDNWGGEMYIRRHLELRNDILRGFYIEY